MQEQMREFTINSCTLKMLLKTCSEERNRISEQVLEERRNSEPRDWQMWEITYWHKQRQF